MSSPNASQALIRPDLRNAVVEAWSVSGEAATFTADTIAARIDVPFASGSIKRIPREAMTKDPSTTSRGPDGTYAEIEWGDETYVYSTNEKGLAAPIDANLAAQTGIYYDAEVAAAKIVMSKLMRDHEKTVAAAAFSSATFTGAPLTTAAAVKWNVPATATPIDDVNGARAKVRQNCGRNANTLIISWTNFQALCQTSQILNRINGGARSDQPAIAQAVNVAALFQLDRIIIAGGIKDTANQGQAFVGGDIWDATKGLVCYVNPAASLFDINVLNCYSWEGDGGSFGWTVEKYWDENKRRWMVRARRQVGVKVEYPECGHLLTNLG